MNAKPANIPKPGIRGLILLTILVMVPTVVINGQNADVTNQSELSEAITNANTGSISTITLQNDIILGTGLPGITSSNLTIDGNGFTLSRNPSGSQFGIIHNSSGHVTVNNLTITGGDRTGNGGGGIFNDGTITVTNCTVSGNTAGHGGGIHNGGNMTITNCTVSNNTSVNVGGGIYNYGSMTITNSTISGNSSFGGGGIYYSGPYTMISDCTITGNSAVHGGGVLAGLNTMTLTRSIVSGNSATGGGFEVNWSGGTIVSDAHNVFGHNALSNSQAFLDFAPGVNDINCTSDGASPTALTSILDPLLADNGGPTFTHALVADSPAIDVATEGPSADQRGLARPYGTAFDAGAFEYGAGPITPPGPTPTALVEEYEHHLVANTISPIHCDLDPNDILGASPSHTISSGALPRHLGIEGEFLTGTFGSIGTYRFSISSTGGINEVRNHIIIQVIPPTLTPFISGVWVNDAYQPTIVQQERTHGDAALTELLNIHAIAGSPLRMVFDWDYIKHSYSFKIIRGSLPDGLTLRETVVGGLPTAIVEGIPTTPGEYIFVVSVKDWRERGYQWIRLVVE